MTALETFTHTHLRLDDEEVGFELNDVGQAANLWCGLHHWRPITLGELAAHLNVTVQLLYEALEGWPFACFSGDGPMETRVLEWDGI